MTLVLLCTIGTCVAHGTAGELLRRHSIRLVLLLIAGLYFPTSCSRVYIFMHGLAGILLYSSCLGPAGCVGAASSCMLGAAAAHAMSRNLGWGCWPAGGWGVGGVRVGLFGLTLYRLWIKRMAPCSEFLLCMVLEAP
jgi:hypothetical protein